MAIGLRVDSKAWSLGVEVISKGVLGCNFDTYTASSSGQPHRGGVLVTHWQALWARQCGRVPTGGGRGAHGPVGGDRPAGRRPGRPHRPGGLEPSPRPTRSTRRSASCRPRRQGRPLTMPYVDPPESARARPTPRTSGSDRRVNHILDGLAARHPAWSPWSTSTGSSPDGRFQPSWTGRPCGGPTASTSRRSGGVAAAPDPPDRRPARARGPRRRRGGSDQPVGVDTVTTSASPPHPAGPPAPAGCPRPPSATGQERVSPSTVCGPWPCSSSWATTSGWVAPGGLLQPGHLLRALGLPDHRAAARRVGKRGAASGSAAFWLRRARRLLPALLVVLVAVTLMVRFAEPAGLYPDLRMSDAVGPLLLLQLVADRRQRQLLRGHRGRLPPHPHLVPGRGGAVLPGLAPGGAGRPAPGPDVRPGDRGPAGGVGAGAVASAVEMAFLYQPGANTTRLYFGTDTHAQSILVGATLACVLTLVQRHRGTRAWPRWPLAPGPGPLLTAVGLAGFGRHLRPHLPPGAAPTPSTTGAASSSRPCRLPPSSSAPSAWNGPIARVLASRPWSGWAPSPMAPTSGTSPSTWSSTRPAPGWWACPCWSSRPPPPSPWPPPATTWSSARSWRAPSGGRSPPSARGGGHGDDRRGGGGGHGGAGGGRRPRVDRRTHPTHRARALRASHAFSTAPVRSCSSVTPCR